MSKRVRLLPTTRNKRLQVVVIAVAVVMGLVVAFTGKAYYDSNNGPLAICGEFRDALGLYPGNQVKVLGVQVGNITAIDPEADRVVVRMTVRRGVTLPADLSAVTITNSIVTDRHIELSPYKGGGTFDYRTCIPQSRTRTPVGFTEDERAMAQLGDELTGKDVNAPLQQRAPDVLGDSIDEIARQISENAQPLNTSIRNISDILGDSAMASNFILKQILDKIKQVSQGLNTSQYGVSYVISAMTDVLNISNRVLPDLVQIVHDIADWVPFIANVIAYKWGHVLAAVIDGGWPVLDKAMKDLPAFAQLLNEVPLAAQGMLTLLNHGLGYVPPTLQVNALLAQDVCSVAKPWYGPCDRDFAKGGTMNVGIANLVLSAAGAR